MKSAVFIYLAVTSLSGVCAEKIIPAYIEKESGDWFVYAAASPLNISARTKLGVSGGDEFPVPLPLPRYNAIPVTLCGIENKTTDSVYTFPSFTRGLVLDDQVQKMSLFHRGPLIRNYRSVALVRSSLDVNGGPAMFIHSVSSSFDVTCIPGSLMRMNFFASNPRMVVKTEHVETQVGEIKFEEVFDVPKISSNGSISSAPAVAIIPAENIEHIQHSLLASGARQVGLHSYSHCPRTVEESLPSIEISGPYRGRLVVTPEQYMQFSEGETCSLLVRKADRRFLYDPAIVAVNPFRLKNVNVRISDNGIWEMCQSNAGWVPTHVIKPFISRDPLVPASSAHDGLRRFFRCIGRLCST